MAVSTLRVGLLGGFRAEVDGRAILEGAWRVRKAKSLVKLLALAPGHTLPRDRALDLLWPAFEPPAAANNLRRTLHAARAALGDAAWLEYDGHALRLRTASLTLDVTAFRAAIATARASGDPAQYAAALTLYQGDLLPEDAYEDWTSAPRDELRRLYLAALDTLASLHRARGDTPAAIAALERLVAADPLHEPAHESLMRLHVEQGQAALALRRYRILRDLLRRELDVEPEEATQRLYQQLVTGRNTPAAIGVSEEVSPSHNLPQAYSSFVGRDRELDELRRRLETMRLITLTGPGGAGKTRLALEGGHDLVSAFQDGVWLVELGALSDPALVAQSAADALGVHLSSRTPIEALQAHCRSRRLLLILDNCEHLLAGAAALARDLLAAGAGVRVLVTSREPLGLPGELVWRIPPLGLPDQYGPPERLLEYGATRLFVERAAAARPEFSLDTRTAPLILRLCRRLDALPLAIELCAALAASLPLDRLEGTLRRDLTSSNRVGPLRFRSLRAAVQWSYVLLSPEQQQLFIRLAVFEGGFTFDAAQAICGAGDTEPEAGVLPLLAALVEKSLVTLEPASGRYRMLETIRQFAAERLAESAEPVEVAQRHARFFLDLAALQQGAYDRVYRVEWVDQLLADRENFRAALKRVIADGNAAAALMLAERMGPVWLQTAALAEGRDVLGASLSLPEEVSPHYQRVRAAALGLTGHLAFQHGDFRPASTYFTEAVEINRRLGDRVAEANALSGLAQVTNESGRTDEAVRLYSQVLAIGREIGDAYCIARAEQNLGLLAYVQGDLEKALGLLESSREQLVRLDHLVGVPLSAHNLGCVHLELGNYAAAGALFRESLRLTRERRLPRMYPLNLEGLACVAITRGDAALAARLAGGSAVVRERHEFPLRAPWSEKLGVWLARGRRALGATAWEDVYAAGMRLQEPALVDLALEMLPSPDRVAEREPALV